MIMAQNELDRLIDGATEEQLRDIVKEWVRRNGEFGAFVEHSLNPPFDEIDFDAELGRALMHEAQRCVARRGNEILDWSNIYCCHIEPWTSKSESLTTSGLWNLIAAIITRVAMTIDDEDFSGNDWYGNDYSQDIGAIIDALGNLCGLLVARPDLTEDGLAKLEKIIVEAQAEDKIGNYMDTPYDTVMELIGIRREAEEISCGLYDVMIDADYNHEAGRWVCRKVDFVRSMGLIDEALSMLEQNLRYPEVCLKYYNELVSAERWQDAMTLLDKVHALKKKDLGWHWYSINPDWLSLKQNLIVEHGTKEMQIANLTEMFHDNFDEKKNDCYMKLRQLVAEKDWKGFYTDLLSHKSVQSGFELDSIAPFLIIEQELAWLYRELEQNEQRDKTDYRRPLKYASALMSSHNIEIRAMLVRTFREYAADRFAPKKSVSSGKYSYFCHELQSLADIGAKEELVDLIRYFRNTYRRRPSFMAELRRIEST